MILHREKSLARSAQTLHRPIVKIDVRQLGPAADGIRVDRESMVLRGDLNPTRSHVHHGMVRTVMAEAEFVSFAAKGEPDDLMAEADAENRFLPEQTTNRVMRIRQSSRIGRTI